jgi:hypothetical protein
MVELLFVAGVGAVVFWSNRSQLSEHPSSQPSRRPLKISGVETFEPSTADLRKS